MTLILFAVILLAVLAIYLAVLATWAVLRDPTIPHAGRVARIVVSWLLPVGAAVSILRSTAELSPDSLPPQSLLSPVRWLLRTSPQKPNNLADEENDAGSVSSGRNDD